MSTNDVPGAKAENHDTLAMGCWAEHKDGSLMFVESTEGSRVVYSIFDMSKTPPVEYRDAMLETSFKKTFSWDASAKNEKWTWHDKTPFDWNRVIKAGATDGGRLPSAEHIMTAAERVAESLQLRGAELRDDMSHRAPQVADRVDRVLKKIKKALNELRE